MSVNPVVMIQLMQSYHFGPQEGKRTFTFQKNKRMRVHKETDEEVSRRKSLLDNFTCKEAELTLKNRLADILKGRVGKVWIDQELKRIVPPLETSTGNDGFGVLPTGSRIRIPEGKFIRAFTYWEKVNDIDLSCFGISENGSPEEFSWRNMYSKQGEDITYSGDQTSGFNGGSEYFDINIEEFRENHPDIRYMVFTDNVYSGIDFKDCNCIAGFMIREKPVLFKGERKSDSTAIQSNDLFDPKTVQTSWRVNIQGTFGYLFAIDLETREMIWLNIGRAGKITVAGTTEFGWILKYLEMADIFNMKDLFSMAGTIVDHPEEAELLFTDKSRILKDGQKVIHSWDFEKMLGLLKA